MAVAMAALDADVEILGADAAQTRVPISEFYRDPADSSGIETVLRAGDMITAVSLPAPPRGEQIHRKVRDRASYEFALVSVAAVIDTDGETIRGARIAFGGVAHKPWRPCEVEAVLEGQPATSSTFQAAANAAMADAKGRDHNDFKVELAKRTLRRTLAAVVEREESKP
jgi:xanthine dehydrogenase YagS FAD-binding subunit